MVVATNKPTKAVETTKAKIVEAPLKPITEDILEKASKDLVKFIKKHEVAIRRMKKEDTYNLLFEMHRADERRIA